MPMYNHKKLFADYPLDFHRIAKELHAWYEAGQIEGQRTGQEVPEVEFHLTTSWKLSDAYPNPEKKANTEYNRWGAFRTCCRRSPMNPYHHMFSVANIRAKVVEIAPDEWTLRVTGVSPGTILSLREYMRILEAATAKDADAG